MDITFLGPFWSWAVMYLLLLLPIVLSFEIVKSAKAPFWGRGLRFNSVVAVRNWSFLALTLGTLGYSGKAFQTLTNRYVSTSSDIGMYVNGVTKPVALAHNKTAYSQGTMFDHASLNISHLSDSTRWLIVARDFAEQLTWIGLAAVLFVLCSSAYRGKPFKALVVRSLYVYASLIAVSQTALQYLQGRLSGALVHEVAILGHRNIDVNWPQGGSYSIPGWQFGLAILLVAVAQIFKRGESLQRETEGLI
jgi:hypothetical protein